MSNLLAFASASGAIPPYPEQPRLPHNHSLRDSEIDGYLRLRAQTDCVMARRFAANFNADGTLAIPSAEESARRVAIIDRLDAIIKGRAGQKCQRIWASYASSLSWACLYGPPVLSVPLVPSTRGVSNSRDFDRSWFDYVCSRFMHAVRLAHDEEDPTRPAATEISPFASLSLNDAIATWARNAGISVNLV
jgi:hypothetical protein